MIFHETSFQEDNFINKYSYKFISQKTLINKAFKIWSFYAHKKFSKDFIREFQDKIDWDRISIYQKLSEDFIREFQNKVDWYYISEYQKLSENFIREFQYKINWDCIFIYQKLSRKFMIEFINEIRTNQFIMNEHISKEDINFIIKIKENQI